MKQSKQNILYICHYGWTPKDFYFDKRGRGPMKRIGDGGSNIHIHFIQYLVRKRFNIYISTFNDNYQYEAFFKGRAGVKIVSYWTPQKLLGRYNLFLENLYKMFFLSFKRLFSNDDYELLISASDFLPDVFISFLLKLKNPSKKWVASYFLEAPKPWSKNNPYKTSPLSYLSGILYWLVQLFSYWLIKWKADFILVTSQPDVKKFITKKRNESKIIVVQGGVDITESEKYLRSNKIIPVGQRKYDACFVGRFHYQKGVVELIKIWSFVCQTNKNAKLAIIGIGDLEMKMKKEIAYFRLEDNIDLLGYKTGREKYEIFKQAKIMVHPATYDSGGMASAEGMAWGLPGVSFDLESLKTYYPKGMIKARCFDFKKFAENILKLLSDRNFYNDTSKQARNLIAEVWDWKERAEIVFKKINK